MDNTILEVVLGLVLIYITLALLVMKLQETIAGRWLRRRVSNLYSLVDEALGHNDELKKRFFDNPLIFALSEGSEPARKGMVRDTGPSSIPPALFARALLIELNDDGQHGHPAERYASPNSFIADKAPTGIDAQQDQERVWGSLRGLSAGCEANWPAFEAAIAHWFLEIGDRSDGWFKRESQKWSLRLALLLALLLNVDSFYIAEQLSITPDLRRSLASLAELVNAQFPQATPVSTTTTAANGPSNSAERPELRVSAGMVDAVTRLNEAFFRDKSIATFRFDQVDLKKPKQEGNGTQTSGASHCRSLINPEPTKSQYLSNPATWLVLLPNLMVSIEEHQVQGKEDSARDGLMNDYMCLSAISAWVRSAISASSDVSVRSTMREAAVALESAKSGLLEMIENKRPTRAIKALFRAAPEVFSECAKAPGASRSSLQQCVARAEVGQVRLPIGPFMHNLRQQFCRVVESPLEAVGGASAPKESSSFSLCPGDSFAGSPALGIPQLTLESSGFAVYIIWLLGCLVTAFFVALGAPFWFDVLGKVVNLRAAGRTRDDQDDKQRGQGNAPAAPLASGAAGETAPGRGTVAPFSLARNDFEDQLVARDIIAVQQQLGVSASGVLDVPTRSAIAAFTREQGLEASDELSFIVFDRLVRRNPVNVPVTRSSARLILGEVHELVQPLAHNLMALLNFEQRVAPGETRFSADLRALSVLYRYKKESQSKPKPHERTVFELARQNPAALNELDQAQINEIISFTGTSPKFAREPAPWLDWAIGELGQLEKDCPQREGSNPRILEYLDSAVPSAGNSGDHTSWCGAFAAWVINRHNDFLPTGGVKMSPPPAGAPLAANWDTWGTGVGGGAASIAAAQPGDVVTLQLGGSPKVNHVGFLLEADLVGQVVWVLGGNQAKGTCVCLSRFKAAEVAGIRRP